VSVRPSIRPSVCLSVRHVGLLYPDGDIVKVLSRPSSPIIIVFLTPSADIQFQGEALQWGRKVQGVEICLRFSSEIAVYLGNGTK